LHDCAPPPQSPSPPHEPESVAGSSGQEVEAPYKRLSQVQYLSPEERLIIEELNNFGDPDQRRGWGRIIIPTPDSSPTKPCQTHSSAQTLRRRQKETPANPDDKATVSTKTTGVSSSSNPSGKKVDMATSPAQTQIEQDPNDL